MKLGLAILTDKDGLIEIDVPMSGSIDDPDFSVGRMVWKSIGNLFTKLVTAPFAALGKLFGGGGETLERLDFPAGSVAVDPPGEQTLAVLGKALRERPALRLEVEGASDEASDGAALRKGIRMEVRRAKWTSVREKQKGIALDDVPMTSEEYPRWLAVAFAAIPPAPVRRRSPRGPVPWWRRRRWRPRWPPPPGWRPKRTATWRRAGPKRPASGCSPGGDLDAARVFVSAGGERARKEGGARVYFELR